MGLTVHHAIGIKRVIVGPGKFGEGMIIEMAAVGPLALADLVGLDTLLAVLEGLHQELGEDKYRPAPLLRKMVRAGHLGRKSGRGFYDYNI